MFSHSTTTPYYTLFSFFSFLLGIIFFLNLSNENTHRGTHAANRERDAHGAQEEHKRGGLRYIIRLSAATAAVSAVSLFISWKRICCFGRVWRCSVTMTSMMKLGNSIDLYSSPPPSPSSFSLLCTKR